MAGTKVTELTAIAAGAVNPDADVVPLADVSTSTSKKVTVRDLVSAGQQMMFSGTGSPEGVVTAPVPAIYFDVTDPAAPIQYIKTSGTGNTGWV